MPVSVDIEGVGTVELPDSMDEKSILDAIQKDIVPKAPVTKSLQPVLSESDIPSPVSGGKMPSQFPTAQDVVSQMTPYQREQARQRMLQANETPLIPRPDMTPENLRDYVAQAALGPDAVRPPGVEQEKAGVPWQIAAAAINIPGNIISAMSTPEAVVTAPLYLNPITGPPLMAYETTKAGAQTLGKLSTLNQRGVTPPPLHETIEDIVNPLLMAKFTKEAGKMRFFEPEKISAVAVRSPEGEILTGPLGTRHNEIAKEAGIPEPPEKDRGFVIQTPQGEETVLGTEGRKEALPVAEEAGQVKPDEELTPKLQDLKEEGELHGAMTKPTATVEELANLKSEGDVPERFGVKSFALEGENPVSVKERADLYRTDAPFGLDLVKQGGFELRDRAPELAGKEELNPTSAAQWAAISDARKGGPEAMREWVDEAFKARREQRKAMADFEDAKTDAEKEDAINRAQTASNQFLNEGLQAVGNWGKEFGVDSKTVAEARRLSAEFSKGAEALTEPAKEVTPLEKETQGKEILNQGGGKPAPEPAIGPGPGAMTAGELNPEKQFVTSIKNEWTDKEAVEHGLEPMPAGERRHWRETVIPEAEKIMSEDAQAADKVMDRFHENPSQTLTDTEAAILLQRKVDVINEINRQDVLAREADETGDHQANADASVRIYELSLELQDIMEVTKKSGTAAGQSLAVRKMLMREDYSLASMVNRKQGAMERSLDPSVPADKAILEKISDQAKKIRELEKKVREKNLETRKQEREKAQTEAGSKAVQKARSSNAGDPVEQMNNIIDRMKARIEEGDNASDLYEYVQKLHEVLQRKSLKETGNPLSRTEVIDQIHDVLTKELGLDVPKEFTGKEGEVNTSDLISGIGRSTPLTTDPAKLARMDIREQEQKIGKINRYLKKIAAPRTGPTRKPPSAEARRLEKEGRDLAREMGIIVTDPAKQLSTSLASIKTRLRNEIADIDLAIATKTPKPGKSRGVPYDEEAITLRKLRDEKKAQYDEIFGRKELTEAQKLALAEKLVQRQIEEVQRQLKTGEIFPPQKPDVLHSASLDAKRAALEALKFERDNLRELIQPSPEPLSRQEIALKTWRTRTQNRIASLKEKLDRGDFSATTRTPVPPQTPADIQLKAQLERAKLEYERGLDQDRLNKRSRSEQIRDFISRWRREFVLSGPTSLAKLTTAAIQGIMFEPLKEAVGVAYSKLAPGFYERTELERPTTISIESKAKAEAFSKLASDFSNTIRGIPTDIEAAYGGKQMVPEEMRVWMGQLHASLKTILKREAFTRAYAKLDQAYRDRGLNTSDPLIELQIGDKAYKEAMRQLFMEDNILVDMYQRALSRLQGTKGQPPTPTQIALSIAAKTTLPVVKIPTNLVARTFQAVFGLPVGTVRLSNAYLRDFMSRHPVPETGVGVIDRAATGYARAMEDLPTDQADAISRQLKAGTIGGAFLLLGFFNPDLFGGYYQPGEKRKPGDVKASRARIPGTDIQVPSFLLHRPELEAAQFGATIARLVNSKLRKKDQQPQGVGKATLAAAIGLVEEVPFVNEMFDVSKMRDPRLREEYLKSQAAGVLTPQFLSQIARALDTQTNDKWIRKPETMTEHLKSNIPFARETVPLKKRK